MYQQLYEEVAQEASERIRQDEQRAFRHAISLLQKAHKAQPHSREAVEALFFVNRLWGVLLEDLAHEENELPADIRARLISIGIWILKYAEEIRLGKKSDFLPLIEISESISRGLDQRT
jgi:flagellar biosynthesis activator protein FlaF